MIFRSIFAVSFLSLSILGLTQQIYFEGGFNFGRFYDFNTHEGPIFSDYSGQKGFSFNVGISKIKLDSNFKPTLCIGFEQYGGYFYASDSGLGGGTSEQGTVTKNIIDVEFYPFNVHFIKHATISAGFEVNYRLSKKLSGYRSQYQMGVPNIPDVDLNSIKGFVAPFNFGINLSANYDIKLGDFIIKPSYKYFFGLLSEFSYIQSNAKSQRQIIQIGIGYNLK